MRFVMMTLFLGACGATPQSFCNKAADCAREDGEDVPDAEVEQCVDLFEAFEEEAESADCGGEYRALLTCAQRNATCDDVLDDDICLAQQDDFDTCMGDG